MTKYTVVAQDDSNLDVTLTESDDLVTLNITPAAVNITSAVTSVNGEVGTVVLDTDDIDEGATNLYYTDARVDAYLQSGSVTEVDWDGYTLTKNTDEDTLDLALENGVVLQLGQEQHFYGKATEAIANGEAVQFAGAQGDHLLIARADMNSVGFQPEYVIGVATQDFAQNQFGYVTDFGKVRGLDTDTPDWPEGTILYLDPNTPGGYVTTEPSPPNHSIQIAAVTRRHQNQGTIFVRPTHHPDTDEVAEGNTNLYYTDTRVQAVIDTNSAGFATTAYVDTAEADAVSTANAYTDGRETAIRADIPTNNNQLTNGAGYITADSTDTLTNKSGNISMFTNDAGYLTSETDSQTLSFTSPNLTISNGNSVDLSSLEVDETDGGTY